MLQEEEGTVSFQPIGYEGHVPWHVNLFLIYLFYVLLRTVVSAIRLIWTLRKHRRTKRRDAIQESSSQEVRLWESCYSKIRSIRNFSHLTFLLAVLAVSWDAINILAGVSAAKAPRIPYVSAELAEALVPFFMGIIFCSGQFCCAMLLESFVRRQTLLTNEQSNKPQLAVAE